MKYCSMFRLPNDADENYIKSRLQHKTIEVFESALPDIVDGENYKLTLSRDIVSPGISSPISPVERYNGPVYDVSLELEPIPVNYAVYVPPKEIYLKPTESFLEKLRNIWNYLRDRNGGFWEYREARK